MSPLTTTTTPTTSINQKLTTLVDLNKTLLQSLPVEEEDRVIQQIGLIVRDLVEMRVGTPSEVLAKLDFVIKALDKEVFWHLEGVPLRKTMMNLQRDLAIMWGQSAA